MMKKILSIVFFFLFLANAKGQDPQFSQPYANQLYLNPAFTGNTLENRLSTTYRQQWANLENGYATYIASYDHYESSIKSGFGGYFLHDRTGADGYKVNGFAFNYAYDLHIDRSSGIRMGLSVGYFFMAYDSNNLLFADQIIRGGNVQTVERGLGDRASYFDVGSGILYYNPKMWAGLSVSHINEPGISMLRQSASISRKYSLHAGFKVFSKQGYDGKENRALKVLMHYKFQNNNDQLDLGTYMNFSPVIVGLWYRGMPIEITSDQQNPLESMIILIGIEHRDYLRIAYSYDVTLSELGISTGGSHEISLAYEWKTKDKSDYRRLINCPRF